MKFQLIIPLTALGLVALTACDEGNNPMEPPEQPNQNSDSPKLPHNN